MADQTERIILDALDKTQGAVKSANAGIESVENAAGRAAKKISDAGQAQAGVIVSLTSTSQKQIDSIVASTERRLNTLKTPLERLNQQQATALGKVAGDPTAVARVTAAFGQLIAAEEKHNTVAAKIAAAIRDPLGAAGNAVESFAAKFGTLGAIALGAGAAFAAAAKSSYDFVFAASEAAERTTILSDQLGISVEEVQSLAGASKIAGTDIEGLVGITRRFSTTLVEGGPAGKEAIANIQKLGVKVLDMNGQFRSGSDVLRDYSRHIGEFKNHATLVDNLSTVFGRTAISQITLIKGINELEASAQKAGAVLSAELIKKLADSNDKMDALGISANALKLKLAQQIILGVEFVGIVANDPISQSIFKFISGATGDGVRAIQAYNKNQTAKIKAEIPTEFGPGIFDSYAVESIKRGDAKIAKFLAESSLDSLESKVENLGIQRSKAGSKLAEGGLESVAAANIANFKRIGAELTAAKKQLSDAQALPEARKAAVAGILEAQSAELTGISKINAERKKAIFESLNDAKIRADVNRKFDILVSTQKRKDYEEEQTLFLNNEEEKRKETFATFLTIQQSTRDNFEARRTLEQEGIGQSRDAQLRSLELVQAQTLAQHLSLTSKRASIEIEADRKLNDFRQAFQVRLYNDELSRIQSLLEEKKLSEAEYLKVKELATRKNNIELEKLGQESSATILRTQQDAQIKSSQLILDHNRSLFDSFKQQAGSVFDAILTRGQNVFEVLGNTIKTAFLTAIKDVVSSQVAAKLTQLVTGTNVSLVNQTPGAGPLGKIAAALGLGAKPIFGQISDVKLVNGAVPVVVQGVSGPGGSTSTPVTAAAGGSGVFAALAGLGGFGLGGLTSARTPPFIGGAQSTITYPTGGSETFGGLGTVGGSTGGGGGLVGSIGGLLGSFKGFLSGLGGLGGGSGRVGDIAGGVTGGPAALAPKGIGGVGGGLALLGGGILAADGLRRGGLLGLAETTGGGALIGAKFGGSVGAAIGAGVGFAAGLIRLQFKGSAEKIQEKAKQLYGIDIDKSFASDPLGKLIKANYGGNIELGMRSPEIRNLMELYAQTRLDPKDALNFPLQNKPYGVGLSLSGGSLYQTAASVNGTSIAYGGGTAALQGTADRTINTNGSPVVIQSVQILMNGEGVSQALSGEIIRNPGAVATAGLAAQSISAGRQQSYINSRTPGLLLA